MATPAVKIDTTIQSEPAREEQLRMILELSLSMLDKAKAFGWDDLVSLEEQRTAYIRDFFSVPISENEATSVEKCIKQVLEIDKQIMSLVEESRRQAMGDMRKISRGREAHRAYTEEQI